jgi:hypothetical protein
MQYIGNLLANINWNVPTWDLFILMFFITVGILFAFTLGKARILFVLLSLYVGLAITSSLSFFITEEKSSILRLGSASALKITVFILCVVVLFILFSRMGVLSSFSVKINPLVILFFSFLQVGLLISIILSFLPSETILSFAPLTQKLFTANYSKILWMVVPIIAMALIKKKESS